MQTSEILSAWNKILKGQRPSLSIEITKECPCSVRVVTRMRMHIWRRGDVAESQ